MNQDDDFYLNWTEAETNHERYVLLWKFLLAALVIFVVALILSPPPKVLDSVTPIVTPTTTTQPVPLSVEAEVRDTTFPTYPLEVVMAAIEADPEWQNRQRSLNGRILLRLYPERYTVTTDAKEVVDDGTIHPVSVVQAPSTPTTTTTMTTTENPPTSGIQWRPDVERWRGLIAVYFEPGDVERALAIVRCESVGDPNAYNSGGPVSGLFQHKNSFWASRSKAAGWEGADIFNPEANIAVAAWLVYHTDSSWEHWSGKAWGVDSCLEYAIAQLGE